MEERHVAGLRERRFCDRVQGGNAASGRIIMPAVLALPGAALMVDVGRGAVTGL